MSSPEELVQLAGQLHEIGRFYRAEGKWSHSYEGVTLTDSEIWALCVMSGSEGITQNDLGRRILISKSAVSSLAERLEQKGLIRRDRAGVSYQLFLTDLGRKVCQASQEACYRWANEMAEAIPVELEELKAANRVLEAIKTYLGQKYMPN